MITLAVETSSEQLGVAIVDDDRVLSSFELLADKIHAVELPGALKKVLTSPGLSLENIDAIAIDIGPGSFTGLRIGVAFVKALVFSVKKPVIGVPSLDVIASGLPFCPHQICTLIDAKQRKVYSAFYCFNGNKLEKTGDYHLGKIEELVPKMKKEKTVLIGDGALLYREFLTEQLGELAVFAKAENHLPRVVVLGRLGIERLKKGQKDDPASLVPMYLYPMDCSIRPKTPSIAATETAEKGA